MACVRRRLKFACLSVGRVGGRLLCDRGGDRRALSKTDKLVNILSLSIACSVYISDLRDPRKFVYTRMSLKSELCVIIICTFWFL